MKIRYRIISTMAVLMVLGGISVAQEQEGVVEFGDENLRLYVKNNVGTGQPTPEDMLSAVKVGDGWDLCDCTSLKGLEYAKKLQQLYLCPKAEMDYSLLSNCSDLIFLRLAKGSITDLSRLAVALKGIPLEILSLDNNQIADLAPLVELDFSRMRRLDLSGNPLNRAAYKLYIPQLERQYPQLEIARPFQPEQLIMPGVVFGLMVLGGVIILIRQWTEKGWILEVIIGILTAGVGGFFGLMSHMPYYPFLRFGDESRVDKYDMPLETGIIAGGVFGLLAGMWFVQMLRKKRRQGHTPGRLYGSGTGWGIVLGMICATMVHVVLSVAYRKVAVEALIFGGIFGFAAGLLSGLIFALIFNAGYRKRQNLSGPAGEAAGCPQMTQKGTD